jgi:predicted TIM-barrel fold metal-dependent hydrolase
MVTTQPSPSSAKKLDYMAISADDHIDLGYLPKELWLERLPASFREHAPHVEDRGERGEFWVCDDEVWGEYRGERWFSRPNRSPIALDRGGVGEEGRPITPAKRMADMDRDNVEASVMFPPIIAMQVGNAPLRNAVIAAYNDWAADFKKTAPSRFLPCAMLSPLDPDAAAAEVYRAAGLGFQQVNFLVNDVTQDMYLEPWDVFWRAAEETGLIVSYHVGGSVATNTVRARMRELAESGGRRMAFDMGLGNGGNSFFEPFVNLFSFGTLERHPNLRFVCGESGTGWIPYVVQEMDYRYNRLLERRTRDQIGLQHLPSELFRRQVWATYQSDSVGLHLVEFFGEGHMMWASDYPHPDSTWPWSQNVIEKETGHLDPEMKKRIIRDNAAALYGL